MTRLMPVFLLALLCAGALHADEKADKLRTLHEKFSNRVVVLTWTTTTSARGMAIENNGSTTGLLIGKGGLLLVSNQPLTNVAGGMASMFGGGESTGPENFKAHFANGTEAPGTEALESTDLNLRWFGAKLGEGAPEALALPEKVEVPALGEEVVIIGAHDETLNYARFFRTARINCVIEDGKYYGLDGSLSDCLGGVVVTMDGKVLGFLGQKKGKESPSAGGFGRILGGINDPSKAIGNRILMTPSVFSAEMKKAQETVLKPGFHTGAATETPTATDPADVPLFQGTVAKATWREKQKDLYVLVDVPEGQTAPEMNAKVQIIGADGKVVTEMEITRRYNSDPLDSNSRVDQIGGFLPDPEQKLKISEGWKVVIPANKLPTPAPDKGFRGIERFTKMGADVLKDNYGGVKVGFTVSQIPDKDSKTREAGVKNGDVIYQVNDKPVTEEMGLQDFLKLLSEQKGEVTLHVVRRGGEKAEIKVAE